MKKLRSIGYLIFALCFCMILFTGCNENNSPNNTNESIERYYNVNLSLENYWKYLDWDKRNNQFNGVLTFAYYENVIVTIQRKIVSEYTENTYSENYSVELNSAGSKTYTFTEYTFDQIKELLNHTGYLSSYSNEVTIIDISGTVQFSI